jgi:hypothetical protein
MKKDGIKTSSYPITRPIILFVLTINITTISKKIKFKIQKNIESFSDLESKTRVTGVISKNKLKNTILENAKGACAKNRLLVVRKLGSNTEDSRKNKIKSSVITEMMSVEIQESMYVVALQKLRIRYVVVAQKISTNRVNRFTKSVKSTAQSLFTFTDPKSRCLRTSMNVLICCML